MFPVADNSYEEKKISVRFKRRAAYLIANNAAITASLLDKRFFPSTDRRYSLSLIKERRDIISKSVAIVT